MLAILQSLGMFIIDLFKSRRRLEAENLFLRHQPSIALRRAPLRLRLRGSDRAQPRLPILIPGGSPHNPMGAAALTLSGGEYAIHGTNAPGSIGGFVSYGCIRMYNADILDLYDRVGFGTTVVVTR